VASEELVLRFDRESIQAFEDCLRQLVAYFDERDAIPREAWEQAFEDALGRMGDEEIQDEMKGWT